MLGEDDIKEDEAGLASAQGSGSSTESTTVALIRRAPVSLLDEPMSQLEPQLRLGKLDSDAQPALSGRFGIRSIPTLILLRQGRELGRHSGAIGTAEIVRWARAQLAVA